MAPNKAVPGDDESGKLNSGENDSKISFNLTTKAGRNPMVKLPLIEGAAESVNLPDNDGKTPLHLAAEAGHNPIVELPLTEGAAESVSLPNNDGKASLHLAAGSILGDSSMISSLRSSSVYVFQSIWSLLLSSELPPHVSRIRWTCHYGH